MLRNNGLTIALMIAFFLSLAGMTLSGWLDHNQELAEHGQAQLALLSYFVSSDFLSALFENWESEFLQMSGYVLLTASLFQRGSAESKDPDGGNDEDENPAAHRTDPHAPWPVRAGGVFLWVYSYSLGLALGALFVASFVLHWLHSVAVANENAVLHGQATQTAWQYLGSAQLWFESFQNWQSEFLSTAVLVVLSIVLRHRGSAESKPVAAPNARTGA